MSKYKSVPLVTNLLQQNCYVREFVPIPVSECPIPETYVSIDEVTTEKGIEIQETVEPYPITPESVNSYASEADYRNDISGAISRSRPGVNLGDVTAIQDVSHMDTASAKSLYNKLSKIFSSTSKTSEVSTSKTGSEVSPPNTDSEAK